MEYFIIMGLKMGPLAGKNLWIIYNIFL